MTNYQQNRHEMYGSVIDYLMKNADSILKFPGFSDKLDELKKLESRIAEASYEQSQLRGKTSTEKSQVRKELEAILGDVSRKIRAYAILKNDNYILANSNLPDWKVARMRDLDLVSTAGLVHDMAKGHVKALQPFGISESMMKDFRKAHESFNELIAVPRTEVAKSSVLTKELAGLFVDADKVLSFIDLAAEITGNIEPDFYQGYRTVRRQSRKGSVKMAFKANAIDAKTKKPVENVAFTLLLTEPAKKTKKLFKVTRKTFKQGGCRIMHLPEGKYEVTASKPGYKETGMEMIIKGSELVRLVAEMEKL